MGPGQITLPLSMLLLNDALEGNVTLEDSQSSFIYSSSDLSYVLIGGGASTGDILNAAEVIIDDLLEQLDIPDSELPSTLMEDIEDIIEANSDITCASGEPCISVILNVSGEPTQVEAP